MQMSVREGSLLASIVGEQVNNAALYHHQAIDEPGDGLQVVAYSPDGIVQAVEVEGHPFGLAVQWHPEQTLDDLRIFEALIAATKTSN
jgi:putative glutamine amidotransferase